MTDLLIKKEERHSDIDNGGSEGNDADTSQMLAKIFRS